MEPESADSGRRLDPRISALVNEYFERRDAGEDLTVERFAADHADLADALRPYLAGFAIVEEARERASDTALAESAPARGEFPAIDGYEVIEEIGRGGMGVVYKALQLSTKRHVAVKVMLGGPFASDAGRRRFQREVELAARLRHPNIVPVLEAGHVADRPYYAMDYVVGRGLKGYMRTVRPELGATLELLARICEAVEYAHGQGVIHRDLKPGNVLVDDEGKPHILDFGLAKATDQAETDQGLTPRVSGRGQVLGTLSYLSPEQAVGAPDEIDLRTDVYALGVMLFEALTGSLPFDTTGSPSDVIDRVLETAPARPSSLSDRVDGELEAIIFKALEKDKAHRYPSAGDLAADLRRYLEGEPVLAHEPSGLYVFRKKLRKYRRLVAGLGLAVVAAVVLTASVLLHEARSEQRQWAQIRRDAVLLQRDLEGNRSMRGRAGAFRNQHPGLCEALLTSAHAEYLSGRPQGSSIMLLENALEGDPSLWPCRLLLAEMYRETGYAQRADELRAQAEREAPDTAEGWYLRTFATLDAEYARGCAEQAVQRDASHELAWERLAYMRVQAGDAEGALQAADRLAALGQTGSGWAAFKGRVLVGQGRFPEAIEQFTRAGAYVDRAHAYRRLKEYDKAVADYTRVVESAGEAQAGAWVIYQRATPLWILGRSDEALQDYKRFRSWLGQSFYSDARVFLILHGLGRESEAERVLAAALRDVKDDWLRQIFRCLDGRLNPDELVTAGAAYNDPEKLCEAYYYAGEASLLAGEADAARVWFERCVRTGFAFDSDTQLATPMNEYELAQWRLESLFTSTQPTPRP